MPGVILLKTFFFNEMLFFHTATNISKVSIHGY